MWRWPSSTLPMWRHLAALEQDPDEMVRAMLFAVRLLHGDTGEISGLSVSRPAAATAIRRARPPTGSGKRPGALSKERNGRRAALALAVLDDEVAYHVMRADPLRTIRDQVPGCSPAGGVARRPAPGMSRDLVAQIAGIIGVILQPFFLAYFLLYNGYMLTLVALSARQVRRRVAGHFVEDLDLIDESDYTKPLTMVIPAFNEEVTIVDSINNLIHCDYPRFEVVVVNDGSQDQTMERAETRLPAPPYRPADTGMPSERPGSAPPTRPRFCCPRTFRSLVVIDKENAGKADALNAGINASPRPTSSASMPTPSSTSGRSRS